MTNDFNNVLLYNYTYAWQSLSKICFLRESEKKLLLNKIRHLDLMHPLPPCKLFQFPFDLYLMETLGGNIRIIIILRGEDHSCVDNALSLIQQCPPTSISNTLWKMAWARHSRTCLWWDLWINFCLYSLSGTIRPLLVI